MITTSAEHSLPNPEAIENQTKGLVQTKQLVARYHSLLDSQQAPDTKQIDGFLQRFGSETQRLVRQTDATSPIAQDATVIRTDPTNILLDTLAKRANAKFRFEPGSRDQAYWLGAEAQGYGELTPQQRLEIDFNELDNVLQLQRYLSQNIIGNSSEPMYKPLQQRLNIIADTYKATVIKDLVRRSEEFFADDVLTKDGAPTLKEGLNPDTKKQASHLLGMIKELLISHKSPDDLRTQYQETLLPLMQNQKVDMVRGIVPVSEVVGFNTSDLRMGKHHAVATTMRLSQENELPRSKLTGYQMSNLS